MENRVYPLILSPIAVEKPWGRIGAGPMMAPGTDPGLKLGEIWLTADGDRQSSILNGPLKGLELAEVRRLWGADLLGSRLAGQTGEPFPILLKIIHSAEYLSVQVHPDDDQVRDLEGSGLGKHEAWHILETDGDAGLVIGLKPDVDRAGFERALAEGRVADTLHRTGVRPGQSFYIHAGLLHSIGPGVTLFEIQQNSDYTYRFYDWGRVDGNGAGRDLHIDQAMRVIDLRTEPIEPFDGLVYKRGRAEVTLLAAGRYFALEKWTVETPFRFDHPGERFELFNCLTGRGRLNPDGENTLPAELRPGPAILAPAALGDFTLEPDSALTLLRSYRPDLETDVVRPLRQAGYSRTEIEQAAGFSRPNDLSGLN